jgi:hypothetical protein
MNPFLQEISWFEFSRIPTINKLPLHEQQRQYRLYMLDLHQAREQWMVQQHEGRSAAKEIQITGVLLQEDLFDILQEDGFQIYITSEVIV